MATVDASVRDEALVPDLGRDMVLSTQMREIDRRFQRLEERLLKDSAHLRFEVMARVDALERHSRAEVEALSGRLQQESQDRQAALQQTADDVAQMRSAFTKDLDGMRQAFARSEREQRQSLLDASKAMTEELHRVHEDLAKGLSDEVQALDDGKVARSSLAAMLSDVVIKLNAGADANGRRLEP